MAALAETAYVGTSEATAVTSMRRFRREPVAKRRRNVSMSTLGLEAGSVTAGTAVASSP
jgi:hypothetical protein